MVQLEGVPPPMECPAIDKPLWGKAYDALAKLLLLFRKMNRLPPIVAKENLELRERCSLMDLNQAPKKDAGAMQGLRGL